MAQAAAVALTTNQHSSGVELKLRGSFEETFQICWTETINDTVLKGWADLRDAAEYGAVAIAILALLELGEYNYFGRMHQGMGFDYWIDFTDEEASEANMQEKKARLEVSGILKQTPSNTIRMRIGLKKKQVKNDNFTELPALIAIVEFGIPKIEIIKV